MQKRSRKIKDVNQIAHAMVEAIAAGEIPKTADGKDPLAVALGRRGGFQGVSERLVHRVSFRRHVTVRERRQAIMDFIRQNRNLAGAAVHGVDEDGLAATVRLAENPDSFGHYDFDELAAEMIIDPAEYRDSPTMQRLIRVARDNAAIFEMPAQ